MSERRRVMRISSFLPISPIEDNQRCINNGRSPCAGERGGQDITSSRLEIYTPKNPICVQVLAVKQSLSWIKHRSTSHQWSQELRLESYSRWADLFGADSL
ncbi:uncharacterized protein [Drosophila bipectinata]|uniref:uncharacterized protein isoform X2 n=1 Tax=Drosophila bipectinata TaxID=42026 RepID=UPI0038B3D72A